MVQEAPRSGSASPSCHKTLLVNHIGRGFAMRSFSEHDFGSCFEERKVITMKMVGKETVHGF